MKVRITRGTIVNRKPHAPGDVVDVPGYVAADLIRMGKAEAVKAEAETASAPPPEKAVKKRSRSKK
jgi:hypothetical protein